MKTHTNIIVGIMAALMLIAAPFGAQAGGVVFKASTTLLPPNPLPDDVSPNGHGRAEINLEVGVVERLKLEVQDVSVIGDPADPAFCRGFYEAVLKSADGTDIAMPSFPGLVVDCVVAGDPHGPTFGALNFTAKLKKGAAAFNPGCKLLQVWMVQPVRDPLTGAIIPGPAGEPFMIANREVVALQGQLSSADGSACQ